MISILHFFWQLCLLRRNPGDLPSTGFALGAIFFVHVLVAFLDINTALPNKSIMVAASFVAISVTVEALITGGLLLYKKRGERFRKAWAALLGTGAIVALVQLLVNLLDLSGVFPMLKVFVNTVLWVCLIWWLIIAGYIYHKAAEISILQGAAIAFLIQLIGGASFMALFAGST